MKFHHAAALALTGWYLIMPPTSLEFPAGNIDAPLFKWPRQAATYRSEDECQHVLDRQRRLTNQRNRQVKLKYLANAKCIATGDPRLNEK